MKLQPSGPRPLSDLYEVGGVPVVMHELAELDLLDRSAVTCMGTLDEYLQACTKPADGEVCRAHDNPFSPSGALKVLHGNIAPDGAIVKKSAVDPSMLVHTGPARCFDSEEEACAAINAGKIDGPRMFCSGIPIGTTGGHADSSFNPYITGDTRAPRAARACARC